MTALASSGFLRIGASDLEYRMIGPAPDDAPTIVMLHEGLGCAGLWGDFPDRLSAAPSARGFVYLRAGDGAPTQGPLPRPLGRCVRVFARGLWRLDQGRAAAPARLHARRGARCVAEAARQDRLSPRRFARAFGRRLERGDLWRWRSRSPRARRRDDRAAFRRGRYRADVDRGDQERL